jgi:hypothetical protein
MKGYTKYILIWNLPTNACPPQEKNGPETITDNRKSLWQVTFLTSETFQMSSMGLYFLWMEVLRNGWECFHTIIVKLRVWPPTVCIVYAGEILSGTSKRERALIVRIIQHTSSPVYGDPREEREHRGRI